MRAAPDYARATFFGLATIWKRRPLAWWTLVGAVFFLLSTAVIFLGGALELVPVVVFGSWFGSTLLALTNLTLARQYGKLRGPLSEVVDLGEDNFEEWYDAHGRKMWSWLSPWAVLTGAITMVVGTLTLWKAAPPLPPLPKYYLLVVAQPLFFFGGETIYMLTRLITFLLEARSLELRGLTERTPARAVYRLGVFTFGGATLVAILYFSMFVASLLVPASDRMPLVLWLIVLAAFPISILACGVALQHRILNEAKLRALEALDARGDWTTTLETRRTIEGTRVWPFSVQALLAIAISLTVVLTQTWDIVVRVFQV